MARNKPGQTGDPSHKSKVCITNGSATKFMYVKMKTAGMTPQGLDEEEATRLLQQWGKNTLSINETKWLLHILRDISGEPMFLLLSVACALYFILGESAEGLMMLAAVALVSAISVYQELRGANALAALQKLTDPMATVIPEGQFRSVRKEMTVPVIFYRSKRARQ